MEEYKALKEENFDYKEKLKILQEQIDIMQQEVILIYEYCYHLFSWKR